MNYLFIQLEGWRNHLHFSTYIQKKPSFISTIANLLCMCTSQDGKKLWKELSLINFHLKTFKFSKPRDLMRPLMN